LVMQNATRMGDTISSRAKMKAGVVSWYNKYVRCSNVFKTAEVNLIIGVETARQTP